jgi:hypothetical protein
MFQAHYVFLPDVGGGAAPLLFAMLDHIHAGWNHQFSCSFAGQVVPVDPVKAIAPIFAELTSMRIL